MTGAEAMKELRSSCYAGLLVLGAMLLGACSFPGTPQGEARQTFLLQANDTFQPAVMESSKLCLSIRVTTPDAAPGLNTARIAYTTEPDRLDYFAYHEWVAPPARMIAEMVETRLDDLGLFGSVVSGSADIRTDYRLDSGLRRLQQDFSEAGSTVFMSIKVSLVDVPGHSLLDSEIFSYREPADARSASAGVAAANRAADQFLADLEVFLQRALEPVECPPR